ncbi:hypothetical protein Tco_0412490 [Tanacetum coccineum]
MRDLGYPGNIKLLSDVKVDTLPQPWRTFGTIINKCLSGKVTGIDTLCLSRAQILWGLYHQKKVDYVYLLWEDLVYQIENKESRKNKYMFYPRFTKVIINHFMSQDQSIPRRNKVDWHMANDDPILTTMRFIPQPEVVQRYGAILLDYLTNQEMKESEAYKTYHDLATGKVKPKPKYVHDDDETNVDKEEDGDNQDDDDTRSDDDVNKGKDDQDDDDDERTESDNDGEDFVHPKFSTHDDEARHEEDVNEEDSFDPRVQTPSHVSIDDDDNDIEIQGVNVEGEEMDEEATNEVEEGNELYRDVNVKLARRDVEMTDAQQTNVQTTQVIEDTHVIITLVNPKGQQQSSSVSSGFVSNMLNPNPNLGINSIFNLNTEATSLVDVSVTTIAEPPSLSATTLFPLLTPLITQLQQPPVPTPATFPSSYLQDLPNFGSLFGFDNRLKTLETNFSEFKQMNQFAAVVSSIPGIVDQYLDNQINDAVKTAVQLQSERLREEAQAENEDFLNKLDDNIKKIIKDQVKEQVKTQVSKILPKIEKLVNDQLESEVLIRSLNKAKTSHALDIQKNLYKALVDAYEADKYILDAYGDIVTIKRCRDDDEEPSAGSNRGSKRRRSGKEPESTSAPKEKTSKSTGSSKEGSKSKTRSTDKSAQIEELVHTVDDLEQPAHQEFNTGFTKDQPVEETTQFPDWFKKLAKPPTPDRDWNKTLPADHGPIQPWLSTLAQNKDPRKSFNELMDTPLDFSAFMMNRIKFDTLTPELLIGPTFELMKGTCKSLVELEYFFEEVYKATTKQLDWINPEGQQYPHDLRKPLLLIPNSQGRRVIPFDHFINNDLEIIAVTKLEIVKWHNYKHLDWITIRRDDDKLYKFKEGDFNRIRIQDIEDMLLLLVQGKLTNLTVKERLAFNVSLRMFTRSVVIQRSVENLQLGVESYQKKLNLTKPDTYRPNLKRKEACTTYSNPRGFIYQNKDKKNRLMRIDELHKFSDATLDDVRTALNDRLKGIRMQYLPQTIWRQRDKDNAGEIIQAIDKQLKTRRIIRSLEKFVGRRSYEGDFRLLQRTI